MTLFKNYSLIISLLLLIPSTTLAETSIAKKLSGKILIQVENKGEAWYINPADSKRYFLGNPEKAFEIMYYFKLPVNDPQDAINIIRKTGLGISNTNLNKIAIQKISPSAQTNQIQVTDQIITQQKPISITQTILKSTPIYKTQPQPIITTNFNTLSAAASAIQLRDKNLAAKFFTQSLKKSIEYTIDSLSNDSLLSFVDILNDVKLESENNNTKIYSTKIFFNGSNRPYKITLQKQVDDTWLISNL